MYTESSLMAKCGSGGVESWRQLQSGGAQRDEDTRLVTHESWPIERRIMVQCMRTAHANKVSAEHHAGEVGGPHGSILLSLQAIEH